MPACTFRTYSDENGRRGTKKHSGFLSSVERSFLLTFEEVVATVSTTRHAAQPVRMPTNDWMHGVRSERCRLEHLLGTQVRHHLSPCNNV
jgi:hypothetical protein